MNTSKNWKTIKTLNLTPNQPVNRVIKWLNVDEVFPEYRLFIDSSHLDQHVEKSLYEIANKSGKKAICCKLTNYYDLDIQVMIQERV